MFRATRIKTSFSPSAPGSWGFHSVWVTRGLTFFDTPPASVEKEHQSLNSQIYRVDFYITLTPTKICFTILYLFILSFFDSLVDMVEDVFATFSSFLHLFPLLDILCGKINQLNKPLLDEKQKSVILFGKVATLLLIWWEIKMLSVIFIPVYLAILSSKSGYLVTLCISTGMMSLSWSLRHRRLLSASWRETIRWNKGGLYG